MRRVGKETTMGTSSDYRGRTGGPGTGFKRAATDYAKNGGQTRAGRVMARHVATLGGVESAATSASSGISTGQRLAGVLTGIAARGLDATLESYNLEDLIGRNRFDVL